MAVLQKRLKKQDLTNIETFIVDNTTESIYFNVFSIEETIPGGKSSFQILGSEYLLPEAEIKVELLDVNGKPVFIEAIKYLGDKPSRHISIEVYKNIPAGVGRLTILGSAERLADGTEIPDEWKGLYNVKWERNVFIDPLEKNLEKIIFQGETVGFGKLDKYRLPSLEISEQVRGVIVPSGSGGDTITGFVTQSTFTGGNFEANASPFRQFRDIDDFPSETEEGFAFEQPDFTYNSSLNNYSSFIDNLSDDGLGIGIENDFDDILYEHQHGFPPNDKPFPKEEDIIDDEYPPIKDDTVVVLPPSIPDPNWTGKGTLIYASGSNSFRSEFAGGIFRAEPKVNLERISNVAGQSFISSSLTASIVAVHSPDLLEIDRPFTIESRREKDYGTKFKVPYESTSYEIDFQPAGQTQNSGSGESINIFRSFAEITIKNMKTFSGDVHRVKTYTRALTNNTPFTLISDRLVESSDVLNDRSSPTLSQKIGVFKSGNQLNKHWVLKRRVKGSKVPSISTSGSISFGDTLTPSMMGGVHISGSNGGADETIVFETKLSNLKMRPNVDYELKLRPILKVGEKDILQDDGTVLKQPRAKIRFYISGSKINQNNPSIKLGNAVSSFGDPIKITKTEDENYGEVIELKSKKSNNSVGEFIDFSIVRIPFRPSFERNVVVNDDTKLQIEIESGELHLGRVELIPSNDTNFSPDEFTFVAPMPKLRVKPDIFDFRLEFLNRDGKKSDYIAFKDKVKFEGENEVIQGGNNLLTGSLFVGNTIGQGVEIGGTNSAFIRSVGYHGFSSASMKANGTGSGFMIFSGSVLPNLSGSDNYRGIGLELHDGDDSFLQYRTETGESSGSLFKVQSKDFFFGKSGSNGAFISGSNGNLEISSSQFYLDTEGNISASNIHIAGGTITGSLVIGDSVTVNAATANQIRVPVGGPPFKAEILADGYARFSTGSIASFNIDSNALFTTGSNSFYISGSASGIPTQGGKQNNFISASKFQVSADGNLTASNVLITGGTITGDVDVQGTFSANSIQTPAVGDALAEITTAGYARFVSASIGGFAVNNTQIKSFDNKLILSSSGGISGSDVFFSGGRIGGWELGSDKISSNNLIISSSGDILSSNYISDFRGFRLSSFKDGFLEVHEAKIRGTLRTTVFEKETVNAVGGQLWVANSTTISGSDIGVGKSTTSMSVDNVSGFENGEVALIKKVTQTGFSSEYVRINSSSRAFPDDDKNLGGFLFVSRSWGRLSQSIDTSTYHGLGALSSSISEAPGTGSSYTDGQVIVSTGRVNTGYIRLNANPSDTFTPYMDIIERTGSGVFDTDLKVRIGDLSGLFGKIEGASVSGFGLATDNIFLTGSFFAGSSLEHISFQTGSFEAKLKKFDLDTTGLKIQGEGSGTSNKILLGSATAIASGDGVYIDGGGNFRAGGASSNFVKFNGATLEVNGTITVSGGPLQTTLNSLGDTTASIQSQVSASDSSISQLGNATQSLFASASQIDAQASESFTFATTGIVESGSLFGQGAEASASLLAQGAFQSGSVGANASHSLVIDMASGSYTGSTRANVGLSPGGNVAKDIVGSDLGSTVTSGISGLVMTSEFLGFKTTGGTSEANFPVFIRNNGTFKFGNTQNNKITYDGSTLDIDVAEIDINTGGLRIIGSPLATTGSNQILLGSAVDLTTGDGFYVDGDGDFRVGGASSNYVKFSGGTLEVNGSVTITGGATSEAIAGLQATATSSNAQTASYIADIADGAFQSSSLGANASHSLVIDMASGSYTGSTRANVGLTSTGFTAKDIIGSNLGSGVLTGTTGLVLTSTFLGYKESGSPTSDSSWPVFIKNNGNFKFGEDDNNKIVYDGTTLDVDVAQIDINSGGLRLIGTANAASSSNQIRLGSATAKHTGNGIFMAGNSVFRVGGTTSGYMSFETGSLEVNGKVTITGGGAQDVFDNIGSATASLTTAVDSKSSISGSNASASTAQTNAINSASSSLGTKINPYETQVDLNSGGMSLRKDNGQILADYGESIELRNSVIGSQTTASLDTNALIFLKGGVTQSKFGVGEATIGVTTGSHFEVSGSGLRLKDGNVPKLAVDGNGVKVGNTSTSGFATQSFVGIDNLGVNFVKDGNSVGFFGGDTLRVGATGLGLSEIELNASGDDAGTVFKDADNNIVAVIGTSAQTGGGTYGGGSRVIPASPGIRGMIVENITTNQAIVTGSISGSNLIAREINITGSANVGGLVTSGSVRNTSTGAATSVLIHAHNGSNTLFQVKTDGEVLARDNITAFTTGFTSISDKRLKENVYPISQSLDKILKLTPSGFTWIEKQEKDIGFIAQDVEKIIPELVHETKGFEDINSDKQDNTIYKSISYDKLTIYLVDAIKELTKRVEELEKENKILRVD